MAVVAVSWLAIQLAPPSAVEVWVAAAAAAYTLPAAAGALLLGRYVRDRSPTRLAGWDAALRACALGSIPVFYAFGALSIGLYVALLAVSSVLHSWGQAGIFTLLTRILPQHDHLAGNALLSTIGAATTVIGPAVAAWVMVRAGPVTVVAIDAVSFVVLAVTFLVAVPRPPRSTPPDAVRSRRSGFGVIRKNPALAGMLSMSFVFFLFFGTVYVSLPLHVIDDLRGDAGLLAAFYTSFGVGAVVGGVLAGHLGRLRLWPTMIGIIVGVGVMMSPVGLTVPNVVALISFGGVGLLWPPYAALTTTLIQRTTSSTELPGVLAASSSVRVLSVPLGTAFGGPLVAVLGPSGTLGLAATAIVVLGAVATAVAASQRWCTRSRSGG